MPSAICCVLQGRPGRLLVSVDEARSSLAGCARGPADRPADITGSIRSIEQLGTDEFARLRFGVGRGDARGTWPITCSPRFDRDEGLSFRCDRPGGRCRRRFVSDASRRYEHVQSAKTRTKTVSRRKETGSSTIRFLLAAKRQPSVHKESHERKQTVRARLLVTPDAPPRGDRSAYAYRADITALRQQQYCSRPRPRTGPAASSRTRSGITAKPPTSSRRSAVRLAT